MGANSFESLAAVDDTTGEGFVTGHRRTSVMCGVIACRTEESAPQYVRAGWARFEYRRNDGPGGPGGPAAGHTRWATHGAVTERNAHPHVDCSGDRISTTVDTEVLAAIADWTDCLAQEIDEQPGAAAKPLDAVPLRTPVRTIASTLACDADTHLDLTKSVTVE